MKIHALFNKNKYFRLCLSDEASTERPKTDLTNQSAGVSEMASIKSYFPTFCKFKSMMSSPKTFFK